MALAMAVALGLHALIITQLHFDWMNVRPGSVPPSLDVILVDFATEQAPEVVDFLAQATQRGGGENPDRERPAAPPDPILEPLEMPAEPAPEPEAEVRESDDAGALVAVEDLEAELMVPQADDPAPPREMDPRELVQQFRTRHDQVSDDLSELRSAPERPRRKFVTANTHEHLYASYMRSWVAKVERVGNMNYPDRARRQNLQGSLVLSVDVLPDGSIEYVRVLRSSGHDLLDEAAVRIVRLAAPYAELPSEILDEVDVLTITRTWQFSARRGMR